MFRDRVSVCQSISVQHYFNIFNMLHSEYVNKELGTKFRLFCVSEKCGENDQVADELAQVDPIHLYMSMI